MVNTQKNIWYCDSALLVLIGTSLNVDSTVLARNSVTDDIKKKVYQPFVQVITLKSEHCVHIQLCTQNLVDNEVKLNYAKQIRMPLLH